MSIVYNSTRGVTKNYTASKAILTGMAPDGGLFIPSFIPIFTLPLADLPNYSYQDLAYNILKEFLTDFTHEELVESVQVYNDEKFDTSDITPVITAGGLHYLELFHGPTIAFKDMALSILPKLMTISAKKNDLENDIVILTATSGDTGKAALVGFQDVPNTHIIVFYPKNGVSHFQERQMLTQKGDNVHVVAIEGNFDDAQTSVKNMFQNKELSATLKENGLQFSSANSINIGRLLPQIIYYFYAYGQLIKENKLSAGDVMNVTVPTGNFGNILAAYYAREMGLPIKNLLIASNDNHVLTDFFKTGTYDRNRPFILTNSPSMDILVSSNLERLLFHLADEDTAAIDTYMQDLSTKGVYEITAKMLEKAAIFHADFADEANVSEQIRSVQEKTGYVIDPHTAVASYVTEKYQTETNDTTPTVVASTASPYKFPEAVLEAVDPSLKHPNLADLLNNLKSVTKVPFPPAIEEALYDPIRHDTVIPLSKMREIVLKKLNISVND